MAKNRQGLYDVACLCDRHVFRMYMYFPTYVRSMKELSTKKLTTKSFIVDIFDHVLNTPTTLLDFNLFY